MRKLVAEHATLLISILAAITVVAKIWSVAHGDTTTTAALLSGNSLTSILGALLSGLPLIGIVPLLVGVAILPEAIREGDRLVGATVATVIAVMLGFALAPAQWFFTICALMAFNLVASFAVVRLRKFWQAHTKRRLPFVLRESELPQDVSPLIAVAFLAAVAWVGVASSDTPWLPPETVESSSGAIRGYVIDDSGDSILVLRDSDRAVVRLAASSVARRTPCAVKGSERRSLLSRLVWRERPAIPKCAIK